MFAGHDSTNSTIRYILHLLATNLNALAKVRTEHGELLETGLSAVPSTLKEQAHLTNHLPYTTTLINEFLRLFPPGGANRVGSLSADLIDDQGNQRLCGDIHNPYRN